MTAGIPKTLAQTIYRREGYECALCGNPTRLCIHHIIPRGSGGRNHEHNLVALCYQCHVDVHNPDTRDDNEQAIIEYLSEYYAERGVLWTPWLKPGQDAPLLIDPPDDLKLMG